MFLKEKTAVVTGSVAGLGFAIAKALAEQGANIVLHGLEDESQGLASKAQLEEKYNSRVVLSRADLRDVGQIEAMMIQTIDQLGSVDIVVNNAVIRHFAATEDLLPQQWDDAMAVNVSAAFHLARLSLKQMKAKGWGRIINMSSVYASVGAENRIGYVTAKTALLGMTRAIAIETAKTGVTCNAVAPGTVPTPAIVSRIESIASATNISVEQATHEYLASRQPTGRFVSVDSVSGMITFLCSDAGRDITGAVIPIDGGWTAA